MAFKINPGVVRYYNFLLMDTLTFDQHMLFFQNFLMDFH